MSIESATPTEGAVTGGALPGRPVMMIGLDGLSTAFLQAPAVFENTPNLRALLASSAVGTLNSTLPPYTGPAWTSITTGVNPGRHGIFGFTNLGRPVSGARVGTGRIWEYVGEVGGRSVVINVPITYPPNPLDGILISGMPTPPDKSFTFPESLSPKLLDGGYIVDVAVNEAARESVDTLRLLEEMTRHRGRVAVDLARSESWDLFVAIFVLPDRLGHPWWKYVVPGSPLYDSRAGEEIRREAAGSLAAMDNAVGDLVAEAPPGAAIVVCSDHGFGPLDADVFFDLVLAEAGLIEGGPPGLLGKAVSAAGRSQVARMAPKALHRWAKDRAGASSAADKGRAWTAPSFEWGVRLAAADDDEARDLVTGLLKGLKTPEGRPIVDRVLHRSEAYSGPYVADATDLVVVLADEGVGLHEGMHAPRYWVSRENEAWGSHRTDGVISIAGVPVNEPLLGEAADAAATILDLLGLEVEGLDGRSLAEGSTSHIPASSQPTAGGLQGDDVYSAEDEQAVMEHLQSLGYVD